MLPLLSLSHKPPSDVVFLSRTAVTCQQQKKMTVGSGVSVGSDGRLNMSGVVTILLPIKFLLYTDNTRSIGTKGDESQLGPCDNFYESIEFRASDVKTATLRYDAVTSSLPASSVAHGSVITMNNITYEGKIAADSRIVLENVSTYDSKNRESEEIYQRIQFGCFDFKCNEHVRRLWEVVEKGHESNRYKREGKGYQRVSMMIVFLLHFHFRGRFRGVLQGNANNELEICLESEILLCKSLMGAIWFVAAGSDPFDVITNAVKLMLRKLWKFKEWRLIRKKEPKSNASTSSGTSSVAVPDQFVSELTAKIRAQLQQEMDQKFEQKMREMMKMLAAKNSDLKLDTANDSVYSAQSEKSAEVSQKDDHNDASAD
ncbi:hypothetical protein OROMI_029307 [Orobanche minor]